METNNKKVIVVDLDGTLVATDTLLESLLVFLRLHPLRFFLLPFWLLVGGIAKFKEKISVLVNLDVSLLPYNQPVIQWINEMRFSGSRIVLCTAANESIALAVSRYLNIFDDVIASDATRNLKGKIKRDILDQRFGLRGYDYIGNSYADLAVWSGARHGIIVSTSNTLIKKACEKTQVIKVFTLNQGGNIAWQNLFRTHQWLKNILLFVPLIAAHQVHKTDLVEFLLLAFLSFSLCASAVYITNDLLDLDSDRRHPRKKYRPIASGKISITVAILIIPMCLVVSLLLAMPIGFSFIFWLTVYFLVSTFYSVFLKRFVLIDCLILATLYTLRLVAGAVAVGISLSFWLLAFSIFIFLSLAFIKRYTELQIHSDIGNNHAHGRGYLISDAPLVQNLGVTSGYAAIVVLALYLHSDTVTQLYAYPEIIWMIVPLMLFWISWVWLKAHRAEMHDDPIVFAIKDRVSLVVAGLFLLLFFIASREFTVL